jgi:four helix bundle protein
VAQPFFLELKVYKTAAHLADAVYGAIRRWEPFDRDAVGARLVKALDDIGAGIAAGYARGMKKNERRVIRSALYETIFWLRRAAKRHLLNEAQVAHIQPALEDLAGRLKSFLNRAAKAEKQNDAGETLS